VILPVHPAKKMNTQKLLNVVDGISTTVGRACAWLIVVLMLLVCGDVVMRYVFNRPSQWGFELSTMLYGALFMMCGAYTLAQDGHVRGDFLYGSMKPRTQAGLDLALYLLFFLPGISALVYAGYDFAGNSWAIKEHSSITADGPPLYPFKMLIPIAGALVLLQGLAEIVRCISCLRTGNWPNRMSDVEEIDVVKTQLEQSLYVDDGARQRAIDGVADIEVSAHQRATGGQK
jgi:TRAP-type mannitol/chloroaromatic compound transport system permease small subunit